MLDKSSCLTSAHCPSLPLSPYDELTNEEVPVRVVEGGVDHGSVTRIDVDGYSVPSLGVARPTHRVQTLTQEREKYKSYLHTLARTCTHTHIASLTSMKSFFSTGMLKGFHLIYKTTQESKNKKEKKTHMHMLRSLLHVYACADQPLHKIRRLCNTTSVSPKYPNLKYKVLWLYGILLIHLYYHFSPEPKHFL